jgi:hypothetical protein
MQEFRAELYDIARRLMCFADPILFHLWRCVIFRGSLPR